MTARRYRLDRGVRRHGSTVIGGSPLTLFRLTPSGAATVDRIEAGEPVDASPLVDRLLDAGALHPRPDRGPFGPGDVTVVVPAHGPPRHVPDGAVVVDDGSRPPLGGATIRLETNRGPGGARNAGLDAVTTPLVAFVDDDVALPERWLEHLLPHFADPRLGAVAPRVVTAPSPGPLGRYERAHGSLDLGDEPARVRAGSRVSYVPAAVLVCRTEAVRAIGGFDPSLRFGEDVDLVWRLDDAGWRCRYEPATVVEHEPRPDWRAWLAQRVDYGSSAAPLAVRHPGRLAPLRASGWSVASWVLAALGRPWSAIAVGTGSAAALVPKLRDVPAAEAFELAAVGTLRAGEQIAGAVRRAWFPIVAVAALRSRVARRILVAALVAARAPLTIVDDLAYCAGVWRGVWRERSIGALVPAITSWPGRRRIDPPRHYGPSA